jgi:hypothetical protein
MVVKSKYFRTDVRPVQSVYLLLPINQLMTLLSPR